MAIMIDPNPDGTATVRGLGGRWADHTFHSVHVELIDGAPRVTGIARITDTAGRAVPWASRTVAALPLERLALIIANTPTHPLAGADPDLAKLLTAARDNSAYVLPERPRGGSETFHRAILATAAEAKRRGIGAVHLIASRLENPGIFDPLSPEEVASKMHAARKYYREAKAWKAAQGDATAASATDASDMDVPPQGWPTVERTGPIDADDIAALNALVSSPEHQKRTGRSPGKNSTARKDN